MKRKETYNGLVTDTVNFPAKARVEVFGAPDEEDNGTYVTVKNVIPGQRIRFRLKKKGVGDFFELLERSLYETIEACKAFQVCGGCIYQTMEYDKQLEIKEAGVKRLIEGVYGEGERVPCFDPVLPSPQNERYRNKMEYSFGDEYKDGPMTLGLHKRGGRYDVITADGCRLVHDDNNIIVRKTLDYFTEAGIPYYNKKSGEGVLRHLVLRRSEATGEILVCLVTTSEPGLKCKSDGDICSGILEGFVSALLSLELEGNICGIIHTVNDSPADAVKDEGTTILYGRDFIMEKILGLEFKITPFSFFQTNSKGAEVLYGRAREYADVSCTDSVTGQPEHTAKPVIFDLYSGTGTIAQIMAPVAEKVIGVEIVEEAVIAARQNAALNGLENCEFIAGDVLRVLDEIEEKPDFIILDPPRDGVHPKALQKILGYGADNILYISCKPTSLARDMEISREAGYEAARIGCVDMFPGTAHVETVCLLSRKDFNKHSYVSLDKG